MRPEVAFGGGVDPESNVRRFVCGHIERMTRDSRFLSAAVRRTTSTLCKLPALFLRRFTRRANGIVLGSTARLPGHAKEKEDNYYSIHMETVSLQI